MAGLKLQRSLNPEAPEFMPNRNQNTQSQLPYLHHYHPTPHFFSFPNPSFNYRNPPFPCLQTFTTPLCPHSFYADPLLVAPEEASVAGEAAATVKPAEVVTQKGYRARRVNRNRKRDNPERRPKSGNNGDYFCRYAKTQDMSKYRRNNQYRAAPPKQKHRVVPVEKDGCNTTIMIRNIPNRFTREMLMDFLDDHCNAENQKANVQNSAGAVEEPVVSAYDFLYLPIDFINCVNKGYAFVNFTDPRAVWKFYLASHNLPWGAFQSSKIREIACARLQGKEQLVKHFQSTNFPCEGKEEYLPVCFSPPRDGSREKVHQRTVGRFTGSSRRMDAQRAIEI